MSSHLLPAICECRKFRMCHLGTGCDPDGQFGISIEQGSEIRTHIFGLIR